MQTGGSPERATEFKHRDGQSYDAVTDLFERFTARFTGPLARRLVDLAGLEPDSEVLDVGSGTGIVTLEAARRLSAPGRVVGVDLSEGMLASAADQAQVEGLMDRASFRREDAEALTLPDASFDRVLSLFALFHFPRPEQALAEMHRVLRPGGRLVLAVGSGPPLRSLAALPYVVRRLPLLVQQRRGRWLVAPTFLDGLLDDFLPPDTAEPFSELAQRRHHGTSAAALPGMFRAAGFTDVHTHSQAGLGVLADAQEFWDLQRTFSSKARKRFEGASEEQIEALRQEFFRRCERVLAAGGRLTFPHAAFFLVARRPEGTGAPSRPASPEVTDA